MIMCKINANLIKELIAILELGARRSEGNADLRIVVGKLVLDGDGPRFECFFG